MRNRYAEGKYHMEIIKALDTFTLTGVFINILIYGILCIALPVSILRHKKSSIIESLSIYCILGCGAFVIAWIITSTQYPILRESLLYIFSCYILLPIIFDAVILKLNHMQEISIAIDKQYGENEDSHRR